MAPAIWRTDTPLAEALFTQACEFNFFQAVRLLSRIFPERKAVGGTAKPAEEIIRFGAWLSLAFPASAIDEITEIPDNHAPARMAITFLALTGIQGVLPIYYTERLLVRRTGKLRHAGENTSGAEISVKEDPLAHFFDIFNHRFASFFYRAWQKHRFPVLYEEAALRGLEPDLFTRSLYDLIGIGTPGLRGRMLVEDESLLRYAGLIAQKPHSAVAVRCVLRDYFGVRVEIEQCIGSWYELNDADRAYLAPESERNQLGVGAFLGNRVWDQQSRIRISLGPLDLARFRLFLPDGEMLSKLRELARFLIGEALAVDVQLVLRAEEVPAARLCDGPDSPRLGWSTWLGSWPFERDAADAAFCLRN